MSEVVQAKRKSEPREIIITLGEGGVPAQRIMRGVSYVEFADGSRTADEHFQREMSDAEVLAYFDSVALLAAGQVARANARRDEALQQVENIASDAAEALRAAQQEIVRRDGVIARFREADADWAAKIEPALQQLDGQVI